MRTPRDLLIFLSNLDDLAGTAAFVCGVNDFHVYQPFGPAGIGRAPLADALHKSGHLAVVHLLRALILTRVRKAAIHFIHALLRGVGQF